MAAAAPLRRVAWVGDSYTYFNDLPAMVAAMLDTEPDPEACVLCGGARLSGHAADPRVAALLERDWDAVVLQEASTVAGGYDLAKLGASRGAAREFFAPRASTTVLLFGTWGHRGGSVYAASRRAYPSYRAMQAKTSAGCKRLCALLGSSARYAPVGEAFREVHEACAGSHLEPEGDPRTLFSRLYAPDGHHPSRLGSYLAACVFYATLTGESPEGHSYRPPPRCAHDDVVQAAFSCLQPGWQPAAMDDGDRAALQAAAARATVYARAQLRRAAGGLEDLDSDEDPDELQLARELSESYSPTNSPPRRAPPESLLRSPSTIRGAR